MIDEQGEIYLLHFNEPYKHALHYCGWARDARRRVEEHRQGTGARLMQVIHEAGIGFEVAYVRTGTRHDERRLKKGGGASKHCPLCKAQKAAEKTEKLAREA